jgi:hypothetical protein
VFLRKIQKEAAKKTDGSVVQVRYAAILALSEARNVTAAVQASELPAAKGHAAPYHPNVKSSGEFMIEDEMVPERFRQLPPLKQHLDIKSKAVTASPAISEIRDHVLTQAPLFRLGAFEASDNFAASVMRFVATISGKSRMLTPFQMLECKISHDNLAAPMQCFEKSMYVGRASLHFHDPLRL